MENWKDIEVALSKAEPLALPPETREETVSWLRGYIETKELTTYFHETVLGQEEIRRAEQATATLALLDAIIPVLHEQTLRERLVGLGAIFVQVLHAQEALEDTLQDPGWGAQVRRYLATRAPQALDEALSMVDASSQLSRLLNAYQAQVWDDMAEVGTTLQHELWYTRRVEEALTVSLLLQEPEAMLAQLYVQLPPERQADALQLGLDAMETCVQLSQKLHDSACAGFYLSVLGNVLRDAGRYDEAEAAYAQAMAFYQLLNMLHPDDYAPDLAETWNHLGNIFFRQGRYKEAEDVYNQALHHYESLYESQSAGYADDLAMTLNNLGNVLSEQRQHDKAVAVYEKALVLQETLYQQNPELFADRLASVANNLGNALHDQRRYAKAEAAYDRARKLREGLYKTDEAYAASLASTLLNMGSILTSQHRYAEARTMYERVLPLYQSLFETNPNVYAVDYARALTSMGGVQMHLHSYEQAEASCRQALAIFETSSAVLSERDAAERATTLTTLGLVFHNTHRYDAAVQVYGEAVEVYEPLHASQPEVYTADLATTLNNLGNALQDLRRYKEAVVTHNRALALRQSLYEAAPETYADDLASSLNNLGNAHNLQRNYNQAEIAYSKALDLYEKRYTAKPAIYRKDLAMTLHNLGHVLDSQHRYEEAIAHYERALSLRTTLHKQDPTVYATDLAATLTNLGNVYQDAHRYDQAATSYREALALRQALYEHAPNIFAADLANTLSNLGNSLLSQRQYKEAEGALRKAVSLYEENYGDVPTTFKVNFANALNNLGNLQLTTNQLDEAEKSFRHALKLRKTLYTAHRDIYAGDLALTLNNLGNVYNLQGHYSKAEKAYNDARRFYKVLHKKAPEYYKEGLAMALNNLGSLLHNQHRYEEAETALSRALALREALYEIAPELHGDDLAMTLNNLGMALNEQLRSDEAARLFEHALDLYEQRYATHPDYYAGQLASVASNFGLALNDQGRSDEAVEAYQKAIDLYETLCKSHPEVYSSNLASALNNQGNACRRLQEYDKAHAAYERAHQLYEKLYPTNPAVYTDRQASVALNQGNVFSEKEEHYKEAIAAYKRALDLYESLYASTPTVYTDPLAMTLSNLGNIHLYAASFEQAEGYYRRILELDPPCTGPESWQAFIGLGYISQQRRQYQQAYALWSRALKAIEQHRGQWIRYETDRTRLLGNFAGLYPRVVDVCLQLGRPAEAWRWAERGKNRALLDRMGNKTLALTKSTQIRYDLWEQVHHKMRQLERKLKTSQANNLAPEILDDLARQLQAEREKEARMWQEVLHTLGPTAQYVQVDVPASVTMTRQLQSLYANKKTLLVEYVMLDDDRYALFLLPLWQVKPDQDLPLRVEQIQLETGTIDQVSRHFNDALATIGTAGTRRRANPAEEYPSEDTPVFPQEVLSEVSHRTLPETFASLPELIGNAFLKPWSRLLHHYDPKALLVVPSGALHALPLHLGLIPQRRRSAPPKSLIETFEVSYLASASMAIVLNKNTDNSQRTLPHAPAGRRLAMGSPRTDLPGAQREVESLAERWGHQPYLLTQMQKAVLREHASQLEVVHLATHSCFDRKQYLKSFIQFHGQEVLTLAELYTEEDYDLKGVRLFYLSSCEAGRTGRLGAEELQGLVWALAGRGARAVMASLWPVSDRAAEIMASEFYRACDQKKTLADAYRCAVLALRSLDEFSNPYYWAPFVLYGDGSQLLS